MGDSDEHVCRYCRDGCSYGEPKGVCRLLAEGEKRPILPGPTPEFLACPQCVGSDVAYLGIDDFFDNGRALKCQICDNGLKIRIIL